MWQSSVPSLVTLERRPVWTDIWGLASLTLFLWPWTQHQSLATSWMWRCILNLGRELCCSFEYISNTHLPILEAEYSNFPYTSVFRMLTTSAASSGRSCWCRWVFLHTSPAPKMVWFPSLFIQDYPPCAPSPSFADCNAVWRPDERPFQ